MSGAPPRPGGTGDRLLWQTQWRLAAITLALIAALVGVVAFTTAVMAVQALEANVDRALQTAAQAALAQLEGQVPGRDGEAGDGGVGDEASEHLPASADTFVVVFDSSGAVVSNPSRVALDGYPDAARAIERARQNGQDLHTASLRGARVRLLTLPLAAAEDDPGAPGGYLQTGFVLTLHDQQVTSLGAAVLGAGLLGLIGAAIVTAVVTARALAPIRRAFDRERRFVADASHELRTPIAVIHASAEVLQREDLVVDAGQPLVGDILSETGRVGRLVGDLLTLAASDARGQPLDRRPLDLAEVVAGAVRRAGPLARERDLDLALHAPTGLSLPVSGDSDRLAQLLLVLFDNAIGHSPPGGTVRVVPALTGRDATVAVCDQGPGVAPGERDRIFEPFARSSRPEPAGRAGTGLGLAIARDIVERHGGSIAVDDAPGGGARFTVALPLTQD